MRVPKQYTAEQVQEHKEMTQYYNKGYKLWRPARPKGSQGLFLGTRLRLAWEVFLGKKDVLDWED